MFLESYSQIVIIIPMSWKHFSWLEFLLLEMLYLFLCFFWSANNKNLPLYSLPKEADWWKCLHYHHFYANYYQNQYVQMLFNLNISLYKTLVFYPKPINVYYRPGSHLFAPLSKFLLRIMKAGRPLPFIFRLPFLIILLVSQSDCFNLI